MNRRWSPVRLRRVCIKIGTRAMQVEGDCSDSSIVLYLKCRSQEIRNLSIANEAIQPQTVQLFQTYILHNGTKICGVIVVVVAHMVAQNTPGGQGRSTGCMA